MTASLNSMTGPETSAAEQSRMELQAKLNGLGGINGRKLSPEAKAKKLREACEGFESIFIQKMWQEMRNAVPKGGLLQSREEGFWQDMYDQELSKSMSKAGGIGLADMMYEQLSRNLVSASRSAAGSALGGAFNPTAAPLVPQADTEDLIGGTLKASADEIYENVAVANPSVEDAVPAPVDNALIAPLTASQSIASAPYNAIPAVKENKPHKVASDLGQANGLLQAQKAFREAGDKLGANAVRPASAAQRKAMEAQAVETAALQTEPSGLINQAGMQPGTAEALQAAVEKAKSGVSDADDGQVLINLHNLVANVQAQNNMGPVTQVAAGEDQPVVKRVRRTTNIPQNTSKTTKKTNQAIRTLNVNNVGVNSRQGQGLSAYHAQQEAAAQLNQQAAQSNPGTAVPPLTPSSQNSANTVNTGSFNIPPLTAADSRG